MATVSLALDWTPNTNHVGFYVAKALGLYRKSGVDVELVSPHIDNYSVSPASKVASKAATFGLAPSETLVSYHSPPYSEDRAKLVAVATCLQEDLSAIVSLKDSGIDRPRDLDGKNYASYGARFEGRIVQRLIQADGGKGDFVETTPETFGIWNTLIAGEADATWIFKGWEGIIAKLEGVGLNAFTLADYGISYGYSPVVVTHPDTLRNQPDLVRQFLADSAAGFEYAVANPEQAAALLIDTATAENPGLPEPLLPAVVIASLEFLSQHFVSSGYPCFLQHGRKTHFVGQGFRVAVGCADGRWGSMSVHRCEKFLDWLSREGLLTDKLQSRKPVPGVSASLADLREGKAGAELPRSTLTAKDLFTNDFLPNGS